MVNESHSTKAVAFISFTDAGIQISVREAHPTKALLLILLSVFGSNTSFNEEHPSKTFSPIDVIPSNNSTLTIFAQP